MATDLPDSVAQLLMVESTGNIQAGNALARQISQLTNGALQAQVVQDAREVGLLEGRTASGVLATNVGGPTNPAPKAV